MEIIVGATITALGLVVVALLNNRSARQIRADVKAAELRIGVVDDRVTQVGLDVDGRLTKLLEVTGERENLRGQAIGRAEGRAMQLEEAEAQKRVIIADVAAAKVVVIADEKAAHDAEAREPTE